MKPTPADRRLSDDISRIYRRKVEARNGTLPPHLRVLPPERVPVETRDHGMPWVVAVVLALIVAGLVYVGWIFAVGALLAAATWSVR